MNLDLLLPIFDNIVLPILGMGIAAGMLYGVYRTINRHLERRHEQRLAAAQGGAVREEIKEVQQRMQELEERVDFAERLLTQQKEPDRLAEGR